MLRLTCLVKTIWLLFSTVRTSSSNCSVCRRLTQLECLELCNGHLKDEGIRHLEPLTALTSLSLAQNSCISDASLLTISKLINLRTLNLAGCLKVSGNGIQTLQTLTVRDTLPMGNALQDVYSICFSPRNFLVSALYWTRLWDCKRMLSQAA